MKTLFHRHGRSITYLLATDWLLVAGTFGVALHFRHYNPEMNIVSRSHIVPEALFALLYAFLVLGVFSALRLYRRKVWLTRAWHGLQIIFGVTAAIGGYMLLRFIIKSPVLVVSRVVTIYWGIFLLGTLLIHRLLIFPFLLRMGSQSNLQRRIVIIGTQKAGIEFAEQCLHDANYSTLRPIGFLCNQRNKDEVISGALRCLGDLDDLPDLVELHKLEGAVITPTDLSYGKLMNLIERCIRYFGWVDVHTDKSAVLHENLDTDTYFDIPFVRMREIPQGPLTGFYKEAIDVIGASIGILLLSPILIAAAIAIKLTSPGPVFYTRDRIGHKGEPFPFFKFRSMAIGADQDKDREEAIRQHIQESNGTPQGKVVNTAYVTPVGKFIRKWAIDELPQLFNVLRGDMSLVGPRPVPPGEHDMEDGWHKKRFDIKPGCTGLWKVYSAKTGVSFNDTVLYDIYYARNMNPLLDAYVLIMTVWVILTGRADG